MFNTQKNISVGAFCENSYCVKAVNFYSSKVPSKIFDGVLNNTAQKWRFPLRISSVNMTKSGGSADLVTFTEDILSGKLHYFFLCSVNPCGPYFLVIFLYSDWIRWFTGYCHVNSRAYPNKVIQNMGSFLYANILEFVNFIILIIMIEICRLESTKNEVFH